MTDWGLATKEDVEKIMRIVRRLDDLGCVEEESNPMSVHMDIQACHTHGCPLDLDGLLDANPSDFGHDVWGIHQNIDRKTGKLLNCFVPRCATKEKT